MQTFCNKIEVHHKKKSQKDCLETQIEKKSGCAKFP